MAAQIVKHEAAPFSEINITPLIDVMLVLLVMIILTIPAATNKVPIDLPTGGPSQPVEPHVLEIAQSGALSWDGRTIADAELKRLLAAARAHSSEAVLHMRTDPEARYERFDQVLADVKRSGIERLGFIGDGPTLN